MNRFEDRTTKEYRQQRDVNKWSRKVCCICSSMFYGYGLVCPDCVQRKCNDIDKEFQSTEDQTIIDEFDSTISPDLRADWKDCFLCGCSFYGAGVLCWKCRQEDPDRRVIK